MPLRNGRSDGKRKNQAGHGWMWLQMSYTPIASEVS